MAVDRDGDVLVNVPQAGHHRAGRLPEAVWADLVVPQVHPAHPRLYRFHRPGGTGIVRKSVGNEGEAGIWEGHHGGPKFVKFVLT
jgi:hypothetical protein